MSSTPDRDAVRRSLMAALTSNKPVPRGRAIVLVEQMYKAGYADGWDACWSYHRPAAPADPEENTG